jgi:hypothetical protein
MREEDVVPYFIDQGLSARRASGAALQKATEVTAMSIYLFAKSNVR